MRTIQLLCYTLLWLATMILYVVALTAYKDNEEKRRLSAIICLCFMLVAQGFAPFILDGSISCVTSIFGVIVPPVVGFFMLYANDKTANNVSIPAMFAVSLLLLGVYSAIQVKSDGMIPPPKPVLPQAKFAFCT